MRKPKKHKMPHRRRREGKTDYRLRLRLLKSKNPRFVVRKSLNNIICQVVEHTPKGNNTIVSSDSKELKKFGWLGNTGNLSSAYLTGILCGVRARGKASRCVLDMGFYPSIKGSRIYSAVRGFLDAGIELPCSEEVLPSEDRISGKHIVQYAEKMKKEEPEKYNRHFSKYLKNKINPEDITENFRQVKENILKLSETAKTKKSPKKSSKSAKVSEA